MLNNLKNRKGTSIIEMTIALVIGSIVVSGAFQVQKSFSASAGRENLKAQLQRDILTVIESVERDIRMSGFGLPGNGIFITQSDTSNDVIKIFSNKDDVSTRLTSALAGTAASIFVENADGFDKSSWICINDNINTVFKEISRVGLNLSGPDTIFLTALLGAALPINTTVYKAERVVYSISGSNQPLVKSRNNLNIPLSKLIDSINIVPKSNDGAVLVGAGSDAKVIAIVVGGHIKGGANDYFCAESTEVNIRNEI